MRLSYAEYQIAAFLGNALLDRLTADEIRCWSRSHPSMAAIAAKLHQAWTAEDDDQDGRIVALGDELYAMLPGSMRGA